MEKFIQRRIILIAVFIAFSMLLVYVSYTNYMINKVKENVPFLSTHSDNRSQTEIDLDDYLDKELELINKVDANDKKGIETLIKRLEQDTIDKTGEIFFGVDSLNSRILVNQDTSIVGRLHDYVKKRDIFNEAISLLHEADSLKPDEVPRITYYYLWTEKRTNSIDAKKTRPSYRLARFVWVKKLGWIIGAVKNDKALAKNVNQSFSIIKILTFILPVFIFLIFFYLLMDINKRREKLTELEHIIRNTDNAIFIMDKKGVIEWTNKIAEKCYDYQKIANKNNVIGENLIKISFTKNLDKHMDSCKENGRENYISEWPTPEGKTRYSHTFLTHIKELDKIVAIDVDLTTIKLFRDTFVHELRNHILPMIKISKSLLTQYPTKQHEELLKSLINIHLVSENMLQYLQINTFISKIERSEVDLKGVINNAVSIFRPIANLYEVPIIVNGFNDDEKKCQTNHVILIRVLSNLLHNSLKSIYEKIKDAPLLAINNSIKIVVMEEARNNVIRIKLTDTGQGMSEYHKESLFKYVDQKKDIHWGLALNKELLALIDADIELENTQLNEGTTFCITLKGTYFTE